MADLAEVELVAPRASFDDFARSALPRLIRYGVMLTGSRPDAEDLVQSALVRTLAHWPRLSETGGNPEAYVRRAMANLNIDVWRRRRHEVLGDVPDASDSMHPDTQSAEQQSALALLAGLPRRQRTVLVLRYYEDFTEAQVAEAMGCTVGTVKSQTFKALRTLKARMTQGDEAVEIND